jgi:hypothetical protein
MQGGRRRLLLRVSLALAPLARGGSCSGCWLLGHV